MYVSTIYIKNCKYNFLIYIKGYMYIDVDDMYMSFLYMSFLYNQTSSKWIMLKIAHN